MIVMRQQVRESHCVSGFVALCYLRSPVRFEHFWGRFLLPLLMMQSLPRFHVP